MKTPFHSRSVYGVSKVFAFTLQYITERLMVFFHAMVFSLIMNQEGDQLCNQKNYLFSKNKAWFAKNLLWETLCNKRLGSC